MWLGLIVGLILGFLLGKVAAIRRLNKALISGELVARTAAKGPLDRQEMRSAEQA